MNTNGRAPERLIVDGNEAAARIAHQLSELIAIYPITPASPMGELADAWSQAGRQNLWGAVPDVVEMQSEGGAAGTVHGGLQAGALTTTFTASQGLLLMLPNLYKIAGELTPAVIHVAARSVATHALSIFGDHSDVMAARQTGMAMLASGSVQEAQDLALVAHAATLRSRVPFLHFFDGFRTSHEVATIDAVDTATVRAMIDEDAVQAHRHNGLDPDRPVLRGTAQNPDVFFQAREAANPFHDAVPGIVGQEFDRLAALTGRRYRSFDYHGHPEAERVVVAMGSGFGTVAEAVDRLVGAGERVGVVGVRLYRPFDTAAFVDTLPRTVQRVAVLDRTKEPGASGEPLRLDVVAALARHRPSLTGEVIGGRYGLSSKEFTPAMAVSVFDELTVERPRPDFTVGIVDDVTMLSLDRAGPWSEPDAVTRAVFHGLGSDGTVGANKNSVKIVGANTPLHAQGYFVYDSKKSGSSTVSHLRFSPEPIRAAYLIDEAHFVGIHHLGAFRRPDVLSVARPGATVLLNAPGGPDQAWSRLPATARATIVERELEVWVIDAGRVAREAGLGNRVNTVLQTCFFHLTDLLSTEEAVAAIKAAAAATYGRRGAVVLRRNAAAIDGAIAALERLEVPLGSAAVESTAPTERPLRVPEGTGTDDLVERVTMRLLAGDGDLLPVSALPVDGTFPTGTAQLEKRAIASSIPIWDPEICIDCARCALVCPHAAIRLKVVDQATLADAPDGFRAKRWKDRALPGDPDDHAGIIQVAPDDCTGCGVCVDICPAKSKEEVKHRAINMAPVAEHADTERRNFAYFLDLPERERSELRLETVKGSQLAQPLFEFSGACAGCGETPYLKLLTQQLGDRLVVANATGCSSIYGGNLPTTPWTTDEAGRGPAWANSLFEDNAEFGLGLRLGLDHHEAEARRLLGTIADALDEDDPDLATRILTNPQADEADIAAQRHDVERLRDSLAGRSADQPEIERLAGLAGHLVRRSVWSIGGDGWAYDIGFGGLDHVLASGADINLLVLDTEVYSNTGGQTSKATPRAAIAKFSSGGKATAKKDLGMIAMAHGNVYVATVAMGANMTQTTKAFTEAAAHRGPSLIIAYSPCIAHGIDMSEMMGHQKMAADSGYWPLYRYDPGREVDGDHALHLDSRKPTVDFETFAMTEARFATLARANPEAAAPLLAAAQRDIDDRWHLYEQMVEVERTARFADLEDE